MRKLAVPLAALSACAAVAIVGPAMGGATAGDSVHGGGQLPRTVGGCVNHFAVNARSDADGSNPTGLLHYEDANCGNYFDAEVFCLRVVNNRASIIAEFRHNNSLGQNFSGILAFYEDNGTPTNSGRPADFQQNMRLTPVQLAIREAQGCPTPIHPATRLVHGNLQVTDN